MKFLFILRYDSFIKTQIPVIKKLKESHDVTVVLYKHFLKKRWINNNIKALLEDIEFKERGYFGVLRELSTNLYDTVLLGFTGGSIIPRFRTFVDKKKLKCKIVTGYIGALLNNSEFFFKKGVRSRSVSDLIFVPGENAKKDILATGLIDSDKTRVEVTGLPRFDELYEKISKWNKNRKSDIILFLEQPTFPESLEERTSLVEKLIDLAKLYPKKKIIIKPRFADKAGHAHRPKFLLQDIFENKEHPDNISISYQDIYSLFPLSQMVITISSTGGLESLLANIPTYFITDFCGDENRYGSDYFRNINALVTFNDLFNNELPKINYKAAHMIMKFDGKNTRDFVNALLRLNDNE